MQAHAKHWTPKSIIFKGSLVPTSDEPDEAEAKKRIRAWLLDYLARSGELPVQLAERLGVSEPTISNIKSGETMPGFKMLLRIHFRLGAPLHEVLRFTTTADKTKVVARK